MRIHGKSGVAYLSLTHSAQAAPMAFLSDWAITYTQDRTDETGLYDPGRIWVAGLPNCAGTFTGFYDAGTAQTYAAAVDGLPRNLYLYPSTGFPGEFFSGQVLPDYRIASSVTAAVTLSVAWTPAGPVTQT